MTEPTGFTPDDLSGPLEPFAQQLVDWDESLRRGKTVGPSPPASQAVDGVPLDPFRECVRLLNRAWPTRNAGPELLGMPRHLGRFRIERVLGSGGFGIVYLAKDLRLDRLVALKVPRLLSLVDEPLRERFRREARAAASLDHPHIIPIHETGQEGQVDYLAAAYCAGSDLSQWLRGQTRPVSPRVAAALVACLADAIQYSHQQGILHRDLKPANVLLAENPTASSLTAGEPLPFTPRLTDFGLARLLEGSPGSATQSGMLGTPTYMAPEQTNRRLGPIGPPTDIYGLGCILYELLAGRPPFEAETLTEVLDRIQNGVPEPLSRLRADAPHDLEVICLKCLEKRPADRYGSGQALGDDLRRYLRGEPLLARPTGPLAHVWKWCRRRPLAALLAGVALVLPMVEGLALAIHNSQLEQLAEDLSHSLSDSQAWQRQAEIARRKADERSGELSQWAYASAIRLADEAYQTRDIRRCLVHLESARRHFDNARSPGLEWTFLDSRTRASLQELGQSQTGFHAVALSPRGGLLAAGGGDGIVQCIDIPGGNVQQMLQTPHRTVEWLAFDPAGQRLAITGEDGTATVWSVSAAEKVATSPFQFPKVQGLAWVEEGRRVAVAAGKSIRLWSPESGETTELAAENIDLTSLATSPDGRFLAVGYRDCSVWLWDLNGGTTPHKIQLANPAIKVSAMAFSTTGQQLAVADTDDRIRIYRVGTNSLQTEGELKCADNIRSVAFSPSGDQLAILQKHGMAEIRDVPRGITTAERGGTFHRGWQAHAERGSQVVWSSDGSLVVTVGRGSDRPRAWVQRSIPELQKLSSTTGPEGNPCGVLFTPDSRELIVGGNQLERWSVEPHAVKSDISHLAERRYENLAISPDGAWLAADDERTSSLELWSLEGQSDQPVWRIPLQWADQMQFSPRGDLLAVVNWAHDGVHMISRDEGRVLHTLPARQCQTVVFSLDGELVVTNSEDDLVVWRTGDWSIESQWKGHVSTIRTLAISPDGMWIASSGDDREIRLWHISDASQSRLLGQHSNPLRQVQFTPEGDSVIALDQQGNISMWSIAAGHATCQVWSQDDGVARRFALSPDRRWLAVRLHDERVLLRDLFGPLDLNPHEGNP